MHRSTIRPSQRHPSQLRNSGLLRRVLANGALALASLCGPATNSALAAEGAPPADVATTPATTAAPPTGDIRIRHKAGSGLTFTTADGSNFTIRTRVMMLAERDNPETGDARQGLTVRRARVVLQHVSKPLQLESKLELAISPRDLGFSGGVPHNTPALSWSVEWERLRDLHVRIGQFKIGYSRQRVISSGDLQLVDRTLVQSEFNLDRDIGVELYSHDLGGLDRMRYVIGVYNGEGRDVTGLSDSPPLALARFEWLPMGSFDDYKEADIKRTPTPKVSIGVAGAYMPEAARDRGVLGSVPTDGGTTDQTMMTADLHAKWRGLSLSLEGHKRDGKRNPGDKGAVQAARSGWGAVATLGWMLPIEGDFEACARFGVIRGAAGGSLPDLREAGAGLSWYLNGHGNKLQADVISLDQAGTSELRARLQLQVSL